MTVAGNPVTYLVPASYSAASGARLILHCSGADQGQWGSDPSLSGVQARLLADGYILASINTGQNWGTRRPGGVHGGLQ